MNNKGFFKNSAVSPVGFNFSGAGEAGLGGVLGVPEGRALSQDDGVGVFATYFLISE
jgi:hypothetical protein